MLAGPRSVAIQVVREREKYRSGNGGVIKRKVRVGGGGGLGVLVVRRNEMRHKSRADADEVQHFTLFRRVQVQTISGCCIRADAAHRLHHLFMAAVLLLRLFLLFCAHRNLVSLLPFHLIETLQRSPPSFIPQGNLVDPCFIKASPFFPPLSILSSKSQKNSPPVTHACASAALCKSCKRRMSRERHAVDACAGEGLVSALPAHRLAH